MDEQKFVDVMEFMVTTIKQMRKGSEYDIPMTISESIVQTGPFPLLRNVLEVKSSSIQGKGVFAKKDILPNQVVTLYPCHGIMKGTLAYSTDKNRGNSVTEHFNPNDYKITLTKGDEDTSIYGNPYIQDESFVGHLINDSYKDIGDFKNITKDTFGHNSLIRYLICSIQSNNCTLVRCDEYVYVKATKFIKKGEELLAPYGYGYWCKEIKSNELDALIIEYMLAQSESRRAYVYNLFKQLEHVSPSSRWTALRKCR